MIIGAQLYTVREQCQTESDWRRHSRKSLYRPIRRFSVRNRPCRADPCPSDLRSPESRDCRDAYGTGPHSQ